MKKIKKKKKKRPIGSQLKKGLKSLDSVKQYIARHQYDKAESICRKTLVQEPHSLEALTSLAFIKIEHFLYCEARFFLEKASQIAPHDLKVILSLADVAGKLGDLNGAISSFQKYLSLAQRQQLSAPLPLQHLHIKAKLADLYERTNRKEDARQTAFEVLRHDPQNLMASLIIAKLDRQRGRLERALERLDQFTTSSEGGDILAEIMSERGIILDRLGRFDEAFTSFSRSNDIMRQTALAKRVNQTALFSLIFRNKAFNKKSDDLPALESGDNVSAPLFLVGFTRSGTTLLEQIIASQTGMTTSDELPVLDDITREIASLLGRDIHLPEDMDDLTDEDTKKIRSIYWQRVKKSLGDDIDEKSFLDKQPLNLLHIAFIRKVFPSAKIIISLRDPRDVCLSNFFQMFVLNEAMIHFLDLASTVQFYVAIMDLWLVYKKNITGNFLEIRYEDLVDNPERTIESLKAFILSGQEAEKGGSKIDSHAGIAEKRVITTPSYHDVTQPIYNRAVNRWKNYQKQLQPYLAQLDRFITTFDYK